VDGIDQYTMMVSGWGKEKDKGMMLTTVGIITMHPNGKNILENMLPLMTHVLHFPVHHF
jgi:hypothetical protein